MQNGYPRNPLAGIVLLFLLLLPSAAHAEKRVALVIGTRPTGMPAN